MKNLLSAIAKKLLAPFNEEGITFSFLWYCATIILFIWHFQEGIKITLYFLILGALICYPLVLILSFFQGKSRSFLKSVFLILGLLNVIIDVVVIVTTKHPFYHEHVALILGTNPDEGVEFLQSYVNGKLIIRLFLALLSCYVIWFLLSKFYSKGVRRLASIVFPTILISTCAFTNILKSESWSEIFLGKLIPFFDYSAPPDLHSYMSHPAIEFDESATGTDLIVVIFGESFSRSHSSLYGYNKETNPYLRKMVCDSSLLAYGNIRSASTGTVSSFENMLSTFEDNSDNEWYNCTTVFDVARSAGYKTVWVSNQSRVGTYDNIVAKYAELADTTIWLGDAMGVYHKGFDESLISEVSSLKTSLNTPTVLFLHMMGSHETFSSRYPSDYIGFSEDDYLDKPNNQRKNLASYDTSVKYNDWVVASLFGLFKEKDAVCMYFPDHGLDIYVSDPSFAGHATSDPASIEEATKIPFVIYTTNQFIHHNGSLYDRMRLTASQDMPFNTTNLLYTIADIMGLSKVSDIPISEKSLFYNFGSL